MTAKKNGTWAEKEASFCARVLKKMDKQVPPRTLREKHEPSEKQLNFIQRLRKELGETRYGDVLRFAGASEGFDKSSSHTSTVIQACLLALGNSPGKYKNAKGVFRSTKKSARRADRQRRSYSILLALKAEKERLAQAPRAGMVRRESTSNFTPSLDDEVTVEGKMGIVTGVRPGFVRVCGKGIPVAWIASNKVLPI